MENKTPELSAADAISRANKAGMVFAVSAGQEEAMEKAGYQHTDPNSPLMYALQNASGSATKKAPALAFTENPAPSDNYLGLYKTKRKLLPDEVLKLVRVQDHLVASILRGRGGQGSLFGHKPKDRFDNGIKTDIKKEFLKVLSPEQLEKVQLRIKRFEEILFNCGHTDGLEHQDMMTLAEWLDIQIRNGLTFGRFGTEIIVDRSAKQDKDGKFPFHRFRPVDIGTINPAVRKGEQVGSNVRILAVQALQQLKNEKFDIDFSKLIEDQYAWIQMIEGQPRMAFTHDELLVCNLFPSTDIEHNGYPVSPLDTVISSVTTHLSIDAYKKLYFQNGRATKGILVIQSDEVDQAVLDNVKLQFNASINNVQNSFRTPIFGVGQDDTVQWVSMQGEGLGDDFQFMYDQIARNILAAFSMSPDELPGYSHLSRGTNSQTLSESNNEFKLTAARDTGLRPLILKLQTFLNQRLFPIIDPLLAQICEVKFVGLDAQSKEQESTRLQQDMPTHMTYDEVLHEVDKEGIGKALGGKFPFNERWQLIADKYLNVGELKSQTMDDPSAYVDPMLRYKRDPFFLQYLQLMAQANPAALMAYFAPRPHALDFLKLEIQDCLEGEENVGS